MSKLDIDENNRPALPKNISYLPLMINNKQSVMGMESDTAGFIFVGMGLGHISGQFFTVMGIAIVLAVGNGWVKRKYPKGTLKHMLWWFGVLNLSARKSFPDTYRRTFYR